MSVHAAGLKEDDDTYLCPNLAAPSLETAADPRFNKINKAFRTYAVAGVLHLDHLAELSLPDARTERRIHATSLGPAMGMSVTDTEEHLARLFSKHANEWKDFTASLGKHSFVRQLIRVA